MYRDKVYKLIHEYGIKRVKIIDVINSNRVSFSRKMNDNSFTESDKDKINKVYGQLID